MKLEQFAKRMNGILKKANEDDGFIALKVVMEGKNINTIIRKEEWLNIKQWYKSEETENKIVTLLRSKIISIEIETVNDYKTTVKNLLAILGAPAKYQFNILCKIVVAVWFLGVAYILLSHGNLHNGAITLAQAYSALGYVPVVIAGTFLVGQLIELSLNIARSRIYTFNAYFEKNRIVSSGSLLMNSIMTFMVFFISYGSVSGLTDIIKSFGYSIIR